MSDYEVVCLGLLWVSSIWAGLITIFVEHAWPLILLFRFGLDSNDSNWRLNVSPDGTRFAALPSGTGPIHIYSLDGEILQTVRLKDWSHLQSSIWAADGKSLFTADIWGGTVVLHVDLQGNAQVVWENEGTSLETLAHHSPDGRYLEFDEWQHVDA